MARVRFNLKRPKADKSAVVCTITDGRSYEMKLATGISVKPKHWINGYVHSSDTQAVAHNNKIKDWSNKVLDIYNKALSQGFVPDREYFYNELKPKEKKPVGFWDYWENFIEARGKKIQPDSLKKYNTLASHLRSFEKERKKPLKLEAINKATLEDFQDHLAYVVGLNTQTTAKTLKFFKAYLNWCLERKYLSDNNFTFFKVSGQPDGLKVIMTDEDLHKIRSLDMGDKNYLKNVRSLFILACSTGLRFSDFSRIGDQHLKKDKDDYSLKIRQQKTKDFVTLPLNNESLEIVRGIIAGDIRPISNQKMNAYVKELCQLAGIDEPFEVETFTGNKKISEIVPKYQLVSTHTGRRTFATKLLERGVAAETVMRFTGHRDYKSFTKYVNIPPQAQMKTVREALLDKPLMEVVA